MADLSINNLTGIENITGLKPTIGIPETILKPAIETEKTTKIDFGNFLQNAIKALNDTQITANEAMAKLAAGENIDLHNVMLATEKAALTLQFALQLKNKITEAYQEIMRMQI